MLKEFKTDISFGLFDFPAIASRLVRNKITIFCLVLHVSTWCLLELLFFAVRILRDLRQFKVSGLLQSSDGRRIAQVPSAL